MKARVIETREIIEVKSLYPVTYSRLDCNGKIIEEYDEDELEFIPNPNRPKMVPLDKVCEFLKTYRQDTYDGTGYIPGIINDKTIEDLRKQFE